MSASWGRAARVIAATAVIACVGAPTAGAGSHPAPYAPKTGKPKPTKPKPKPKPAKPKPKKPSGPGTKPPARARHPSTGPLAASVSLAKGSTPIPPSFLGISMEYDQTAAFEQAGSAMTHALSLIAPEDGSPQILRLGGKSADHVIWEPSIADAANPPHLSYGLHLIGQDWLTALVTMVNASHLRLMLDLNLAVHWPLMATALTQAVKAALPPASIVGVEIGNEPDLYADQPGLALEGASAGLANPVSWTPQTYGPHNYRSDFVTYATNLRAALPGIPLGGPDTISANQPWLAALEGLGSLAPSILTVHRYAGSSCWPPTSRLYPKISHLLSPQEPSDIAQSVAPAVALAAQNHQTVRLTEMNSISCGGNAGVANSFATALWAPDALLNMVKVGVGGVNWHIRPGSYNAPLHPGHDTITALPEMYGLAAFAQLTGPGARLLNTAVTAPHGLELDAWAVQAKTGMRVLLINRGDTAGRVSLDLGISGAARVKRLIAPSVESTGDVSFGGQRIGSGGTWQGRLDAPTIRASGGSYTVTVGAGSAALLTIPEATR